MSDDKTSTRVIINTTDPKPPGEVRRDHAAEALFQLHSSASDILSQAQSPPPAPAPADSGAADTKK